MMRALCRLLMLGCLLFTIALPVFADEFRPAYLQLRQLDAVTYDVLWKLPAKDENTILKIAPIFPEGSRVITPVHSSYAAGATVLRWRISMDGGLTDKTIEFSNLSTTRIDVLVRLERIDGSVQLGRILPMDSRFLITASPGPFEVVQTYTLLGIEHILLGFDHLLFVLALVLLVNGVRRLTITITAFTVAHSFTLIAASLGWVHVPAPPLEATIALSIVFLAGEIVRARQGNAGFTQHYPWFVALTFGLLHGLGFASALSEVGLPELSIPIALLFFNVGVEIGQLMFIAAVLAVIVATRWVVQSIKFTPPQWLWRIPPYAIGGCAGFWVIERVAAFSG